MKLDTECAGYALGHADLMCTGRACGLAGEEIIDDYGTYENPEWYVDLCKEHEVTWAGRVAELYPD